LAWDCAAVRDGDDSAAPADSATGDKRGGISDLQTTAQHGQYLAPFARVLLAIAYVRDKGKIHALELLIALRAQFPGNTLFPREIAHLQP
jgi:hypothetical protein